MFKWKTPAEKTGLTKARDEILLELPGYPPESEEYKKMMVHVKTLTELIGHEKPERLSPNTIAVVLGNAVITLIVIGYESKNVVTSKFDKFMLKTK